MLNNREYNISYKSYNYVNFKLMTRVESSKRNNIIIESFGGTGGCITGSCHRVTINNSTKFLVDSGMYQGKFEERSKEGIKRNFQPMKNVASEVKNVLETHVHIDHIGRLPMIFKDGFTPTVLASELTAELMEPVLLNSAEIQESKPPQERLYDRWDVDKTLRHIKGVKPFKMVEIGQNITAEFLLNGHIFGGSSIFIRNHSSDKNIFFTGDMGKPYQSLCGGYKEYVNFYPKDPISILMVESTNFERQPISFKEKKKKFLEEIYKVWEGGGNPVFPTLSFHRTPELMELIYNCKKNGELPKDLITTVDAPYAMKLIYRTIDLGPKYLSRRYGDDPFFYKTEESSMDRFDLENLRIIGS
ncbi:MAG: MBL fold metallo-hydrolase, partial [Candidatus Shapirobacteria bacterium]